jgi:hypothetical protein
MLQFKSTTDPFFHLCYRQDSVCDSTHPEKAVSRDLRSFFVTLQCLDAVKFELVVEQKGEEHETNGNHSKR